MASIHFASPVNAPKGSASTDLATREEVTEVAGQGNAVSVPQQYTIYRRMPDALTPPTVEDTGQADIAFSTSAYPTFVGGGLLTFNPATSGAVFNYRDIGPKPSQITRIGGRYRMLNPGFARTTGFGGVTVVLMNDTHGNVQTSTTGRLGIHLVVTAFGYVIQKASNATGTLVFTNIGSGGRNWAAGLVDQSRFYRIDAFITAGGGLTILCPDGGVDFYQDTDIATWAGLYGFHELSVGDGLTDLIPGWDMTWTDWGTQYPPSEQLMSKQQLDVSLLGYQPLSTNLNGWSVTTPPTGTATGTPSSTTFLRGDNHWVTPPGGGDFSSNTSTSVDSELVLFSGTAGKTGKRATGTGIATLTAGVLSTVTAPTGAIVGTTDTQALTQKDLTGAGNTFPTFNQNTTGSAAKWTTARNLAGNSTDGSAAVPFVNKFVVQGTTDAGLTGAQFLGALGTGLVKNTTTTGVLSVAAAGTDYVAPGGALGTPSSGTLTNCTFPTLNQSTTGSAAKWTTARLLAGNSVDGSADAAFANKFVVQGTTDAGLTGAQFLGALSTGLLKNTTTTGVLSTAAAGTDYVAPGGALGTPSSGTLTNCTFPTLNQSTTGSAATLTTSRNIDGQAFNGSAAITVIAPGTHAASSKSTPVDADELPLVDSANSNLLAKLTWANVKATLKTYFDSLTTTYTNKRITLRVGTGTTSSGTISINTDNFDAFTGTVNAATTLAFTGTPTHDQPLLLELVDAGTSEAITWPGNSGDSGVATRLAATVVSKVHRMELIYDNNKTKWICMAVDAVGY